MLVKDGKDEIICDICLVLLKDVREQISNEKNQVINYGLVVVLMVCLFFVVVYTYFHAYFHISLSV